MEGRAELMIMNNDISENKDGIVLLRSDGLVQTNQILRNEGCGILIVDDSRPTLDNNLISKNKCGVDIDDPSAPELKNNKVEENQFQVKTTRKRWEVYREGNPRIVGPNDFP